MTFDPSEFDAVDERPAQQPMPERYRQAPRAQVDLQRAVVAEPVDEDDVDLDQDVEQKLEIASLYQAFLKTEPLFGEETQAAVTVHKRFRKFARSELDKLFGKATAEATGGFTAEEVTFLKAYIAKLRGKIQQTVQAPTPAAAPVVRRPVVAAPQVRPPQPAPPAAPVRAAPPKTAAPVQRQPEVPQQDPQETVEQHEQSDDGQVITVRRRGKLYREFYDRKGKLVNTQKLDVITGTDTSQPMAEGRALDMIMTSKASETVDRLVAGSARRPLVAVLRG